MSLRIPNVHRPRSHFPAPSHRSRSSESLWRTSTKRAYGQASASGRTSPEQWDIDDWGNKRRRQDGSLQSDDFLGTPAFAATSAEFGIPPPVRTRHSTYICDSSDPITTTSSFGTEELSRLRSSAFGALNKSVAENGEGLVRRMRDYEKSNLRSRAEAHLKVKDAHRRGRRKSLLESRRRRSEDIDDEDDVQIYAGEEDDQVPCRTRTLSLEMDMDSRRDNSWLPVRPQSASRSSTSSAYPSDDDEPKHHTISSTSSSHQSGSLYLDPQSRSSVSSLPQVEFSEVHSSLLPASRSEKALAALSLAMANGLGSIEDYEAIRNVQTVNILDEGHVGEMWH